MVFLAVLAVTPAAIYPWICNRAAGSWNSDDFGSASFGGPQPSYVSPLGVTLRRCLLSKNNAKSRTTTSDYDGDLVISRLPQSLCLLHLPFFAESAAYVIVSSTSEIVQVRARNERTEHCGDDARRDSRRVRAGTLTSWKKFSTNETISAKSSSFRQSGLAGIDLSVVMASFRPGLLSCSRFRFGQKQSTRGCPHWRYASEYL